MAKRPGARLASRPLHFIWIVDCSGSMAVDGKIQALNNAVQESLPHMRRAADENPHAQLLLRVLAFSTGAHWIVEEPTPIDKFIWVDLEADGVTDMGRAMKEVAAQMRVPPMSERALPPVLVLVSDGQPTDDFDRGVSELLGKQWGKRAIRIAVGIGRDADFDVLNRFIANPELKALPANKPEDLVRYFRWASTAVLKAATEPTIGAERELRTPQVRTVDPTDAADATW